MPKKYRDADRSVDQPFLLPPSLRDWLPDGHLAYFVLDVVDDLDLSAIETKIQAKDPRGERPYSPRMMVALLFYGYVSGVFSSRRIASRCAEDIGFRVVASNQQPHFTTIANFRREHLVELSDLFVPVLQLGVAGGVVKGADLYQDGSKFQANASKHKAMSYDRMKKTEQKLKDEIEALLAQAEAVDAAEDADLGVGVDYSDGIAEELKRRDTRLEWIRRHRQELERDAKKARAKALRKNAGVQREKSAAESRPAEAKRQRTRAEQSDAQANLLDPEPDPDPDPDDQADRLPLHQVPVEPDGRPKGRAQRNFTDPDSRIMMNGQGAYVQGYNAQIVVNDGQFVVAHGLSNQPPDQQYVEPLLTRAIRNLDSPPETYTADAGYFSARNAAFCRSNGCHPYLALERERRQWPPPEPAQGSPPPDATAKERMSWALRTQEGAEQMRRRKFKVEPVFGTIKEAMGFRRFHLRGLTKVRNEWALVCLAFNIKKLHAAQR